MRVKRYRAHLGNQGAPGIVHNGTASGIGMTNFNPFRVSFDGPLGSRERARARVTAAVVSGAAIFLGATSLVALLNISSETIGNWSNAKPQPDVRILATDAADPSGKTCEEQTWPYVEPRCLKPADPQATGRSTPKHGLGSQQVALPGASVENAARPEIRLGTTGSAAFDDNHRAMSADTPESTRTVAVPIPVPAPALSALDQSVSPTALQQPGKAGARLSKREQRLREYRTRLQRARREEARRLRDDRARARALERSEARRDDFFPFVR